jgi:hypothetical protein
LRTRSFTEYEDKEVGVHSGGVIVIKIALETELCDEEGEENAKRALQLRSLDSSSCSRQVIAS